MTAKKPISGYRVARVLPMVEKMLDRKGMSINYLVLSPRGISQRNVFYSGSWHRQTKYNWSPKLDEEERCCQALIEKAALNCKRVTASEAWSHLCSFQHLSAKFKLTQKDEAFVIKHMKFLSALVKFKDRILSSL